MEFRLEGARELLTKESAEKHAASLHSVLPSLHKIQFSGKSFGLDAAKVFAKELESLPPSVTLLDFSDIISARPEEEALQVLQILSEPFQSRKQLLEINLSDNALGLKGINACSQLLSNQSKLERLYLNNDGLAADAGEKLRELLLFREPTCLKVVHFVNNLLQDGGAAALSKVLAASPHLEQVRFAGTRFSDKGGELIAQGLSQSTCNLVHLELCDNSFGGNAPSLLAKIIEKQKNLSFLNLSDANLESKGAILVLKALLKSNPPLLHLDLSGNDLTSSTATWIAKLLASSSTLNKVNVSTNELKSKGARKIANSIKVSTTKLHFIDLSMNEISEKAEEEIVNRFKSSLPSLELNFEDNQEEDEDEDDEDDEEEEEEEEEDRVESGNEDNDVLELTEKLGKNLSI